MSQSSGKGEPNTNVHTKAEEKRKKKHKIVKLLRVKHGSDSQSDQQNFRQRRTKTVSDGTEGRQTVGV